MDRRRLRLRFFAALALFLAWVVALGSLAIRSGRKPPPRAGVGAAADSPRWSNPSLAARSNPGRLVVDAPTQG